MLKKPIKVVFEKKIKFEQTLDLYFIFILKQGCELALGGRAKIYL